eukprot:CAMPEP_0116870508 /NCGR_PEP_ID=MMETSP0463-20121206/435_1 /TAXON_ID=181622 /ORGANISM="Strombidinopsis sp, Strain SopsisLIS2011" /LENGTH=169 /DNA_ID=CAMNT_0004507153 /DNA_START=30 /DNA_END=539 /DNA_ORIENTATION=+
MSVISTVVTVNRHVIDIITITTIGIIKITQTIEDIPTTTKDRTSSSNNPHQVINLQASIITRVILIGAKNNNPNAVPDLDLAAGTIETRMIVRITMKVVVSSPTSQSVIPDREATRLRESQIIIHKITEGTSSSRIMARISNTKIIGVKTSISQEVKDLATRHCHLLCL